VLDQICQHDLSIVVVNLGSYLYPQNNFADRPKVLKFNYVF
jgi:hypothetical protein